MKRILVTGMSGVGKSTVINTLVDRGYQAVDLDHPDWSEWTESSDGEGPTPSRPGQDWTWREDRVRELLKTDESEVLFVAGCAANMSAFRTEFDTIVLLSAPPAIMVERLANRLTSEYGHVPGEINQSLKFKETVEPKLRSMAQYELDTTAPVDDVVAAILELAGA